MRTILNFKDKDTFSRLERQSYDGTIDISHFPPAEYRYFSELTKIYYAFKFEGLSKSDASQRKRALYMRYCRAVAEHERCLDVYRTYQRNIRIAEMNLSKIEKSHDVTEIALLACESLGALMGECSFYVRQKAKITEGK